MKLYQKSKEVNVGVRAGEILFARGILLVSTGWTLGAAKHSIMHSTAPPAKNSTKL